MIDDEFDDVPAQPKPEQPDEEGGRPQTLPSGFSTMRLPGGLSGLLQQMEGNKPGAKQFHDGQFFTAEEAVNLSEMFLPWSEVSDKVAALSWFQQVGATYAKHDLSCKRKSCTQNSKFPISWLNLRRMRELFALFEADFKLFPETAHMEGFYVRWEGLNDESDPRIRIFRWHYDTVIMLASAQQAQRAGLPQI